MKFAVDLHGIYGGHQYALKAGGHELKVMPGISISSFCLQ